VKKWQRLRLPPVGRRFYLPCPVIPLQTLYLGFLEAMPQNARCLDIGCGTGFLLETLKIYHNEVFGIETSRELAQWFQKNSGHFVEHYEFGSRRKKNADPEYQFIFCMDVLEHIPEKTDFIMELSELKTNENTIILSIPHYPEHGTFLSETDTEKLKAIGKTQIIRIIFPKWFQLFQKIRNRLRKILTKSESNTFHENPSWKKLRKPYLKPFIFVLYNLILQLLLISKLRGEITTKTNPGYSYLWIIR
jgi:2-polyprenyl-3-methyl-5-hydroxy-6-metoxy-1,4-benzoquinol methylase